MGNLLRDCSNQCSYISCMHACMHASNLHASRTTYIGAIHDAMQMEGSSHFCTVISIYIYVILMMDPNVCCCCWNRFSYPHIGATRKQQRQSESPMPKNQMQGPLFPPKPSAGGVPTSIETNGTISTADRCTRTTSSCMSIHLILFQNFTTTVARKDYHGRTVFVVVLVVFVVSGDEDNFENCEGGRESIQNPYM